MDDEVFSKNYSFLDEYRSTEIQQMTKALKKAKTATKKENIKSELSK